MIGTIVRNNLDFVSILQTLSYDFLACGDQELRLNYRLKYFYLDIKVYLTPFMGGCMANNKLRTLSNWRIINTYTNELIQSTFLEKSLDRFHKTSDRQTDNAERVFSINIHIIIFVSN